MGRGYNCPKTLPVWGLSGHNDLCALLGWVALHLLTSFMWATAAPEPRFPNRALVSTPLLHHLAGKESLR